MRAVLAAMLALGAGCASPSRAGDDDDVPHDASGGTGSDGGGGSSAPIDVFDPTIARVIVEIDYETNEAPYTGNVIGFGDTFDPTLVNMNRVFANKKMLTIPTQLANMQDIGTIPDEELTLADLLAIAQHHRDVHDLPDTKSYYVVFVSGHFADQNGVQAGVLGVSVGDTIAMFKDVIRQSQSLTDPNAVRYVEQSTLIHELSHSVGLVDNGVPMVAAHKDAPHGAHCNNPDCVMYWLNEGAADARDFALRRLLTGSSILFDAKCLADVDAKTGGL
ncbi:MAG: hypothetical protein HOV81_18720 [Kofleriaceae bacterium]|nr:hypothetical protein [Kofleriaceae bacterium]